MKIRLFVTSSAVLLAAWLGVTFWRVVPYESYRQLGRGSLPISASVEPESGQLMPLKEEMEDEATLVVAAD